MELIQWTDESGYEHKAYVREQDVPLGSNAKFKAVLNPPDLNNLDWGSIENEMNQEAKFFDSFRRELHNQLSKRGLFGWHDVERQQELGIPAALRQAIFLTYQDPDLRTKLYKVLHRRIVMLFKQTRR